MVVLWTCLCPLTSLSFNFKVPRAQEPRSLVTLARACKKRRVTVSVRRERASDSVLLRVPRVTLCSDPAACICAHFTTLMAKL